MVTTPVLRMAALFPSLGHFLSLLCEISVFKSNLFVAKAIVKGVLYLTIGPRGDNHLREEVRARNRASSFQWAVSRLSSLGYDRIQSCEKEGEGKREGEAQVAEMSEVGFSVSSLSSSLVFTLTSQILLKLEKMEERVMRQNQALIRYWSGEGEGKGKKPNLSSQFCSFRSSISRKCASFLENGHFAIPLIERIIMSPVRNVISNLSNYDHRTKRMETIEDEKKKKSCRECICGIDKALVERLFANGGFYFEKLSLSCRASLITQCPHSLSFEIMRVIRQISGSKLPSKEKIEGEAGALIESSFLSPPLFSHLSSILHHLIFSSMHPLIIKLFQCISQAVLRRLEKGLFSKIPFSSSSLSLYWPSPLIHFLSLIPSSLLHFIPLNKALLSIVHASQSHTCNPSSSSSPSLPSPSSSLLSSWFTILAFPKWFNSAYYLLSFDDHQLDGDVPPSVHHTISFLAWHSHPSHHPSMILASRDILIALQLSKRFYAGLEGSTADFVSTILASSPAAHPFLIWAWDPSRKNQNSVFSDIVSEILAQKALSITLDTIVEFLEERASFPSTSSEPSYSSSKGIADASKYILKSLESQQSMATAMGQEVKSRLLLLANNIE